MIRPTVLLIALALLASLTPTAGTDGVAGVETGEINGAPFRIEIPEGWQGGLFVYVHGYELAGTVHDLGSPGMDALRAVFLERGYAVAQSAYARQGWAVKEAMEDTEAVRRYFVAHHGAASPTLVGGHSMGGFLTLMLLERYPDVYDGGLSLCGPLLPSLEFFGEHIFDILAAFEYFVRDVKPALPDPTDPDAPQLTQEAVAAALAGAGDAATTLAHRFRIRVEDLPMAVVFSQIILKELVERAGGMPVDSENTVYAGFGDDPAFNRGVKRYHADAAAREYLWRYATPTGRLADPMLALHTSYRKCWLW